MRFYDNNDTISAIATAIGEAGIGIVRISGKDALSVADRVFRSKDGGKPSEFKTYTVHYGWVVSQEEVIDEVILTIMRAPKSYTKEDIVEINCHGGIVALRRILDVVSANGCRLAEPGEFTKRAFLNGRIDLTQAEGVLDIIRAKTDSSLNVGVEQLKGNLSCRIDDLRKVLLDALSLAEVDIDFPDEEIGGVDISRISEKLKSVHKELKIMLDGSISGRIFREGIHAVICGKPNVGKSSLLNMLLKEERSIVSPVPGTTRDTIEEIIDIKGIPIRIVDTAGIIEPKDFLERKAVQRSKRYIGMADLVILVFDASRRLETQDYALLRKLKDKKTLAVINKIDLKQRIDKDKILKRFKAVVEISAKKNKNIAMLEDAISDLIFSGHIVGSESRLVNKQRHIEALRKARESVEGAIKSLDNRLSLEFIAQDIKEALGRFDDILGRRFDEDLLDKIFNEFCIGK